MSPALTLRERYNREAGRIILEGPDQPGRRDVQARRRMSLLDPDDFVARGAVILAVGTNA